MSKPTGGHQTNPDPEKVTLNVPSSSSSSNNNSGPPDSSSSDESQTTVIYISPAAVAAPSKESTPPAAFAAPVKESIPPTAAPPPTPAEGCEGFRLQQEKNTNSPRGAGKGLKLKPVSGSSSGSNNSDNERARTFRPGSPRPPPLAAGWRNLQTSSGSNKDQEVTQPKGQGGPAANPASANPDDNTKGTLKSEKEEAKMTKISGYSSPFDVSDSPNSSNNSGEGSKDAAKQAQEPTPEGGPSNTNKQPTPLQHTPFFFIPTDDPRCAPFSTSPIPGESATAYRIRDQISRSEHMLGRQLTQEESGSIAELQRELRTPTVLSDDSTTPATSPKREIVLGPVPTLAQLGEKCAFHDKRLDAFVGELDQHRAMITVLEDRLDKVEKGKEVKRQRFRGSGLLGVVFTLICLVGLVWSVMGAMLHSKRYTDGYGPYLNKGYNGLQSVVVFQSWIQFLWFTVVVVVLGFFAVSGALRR